MFPRKRLLIDVREGNGLRGYHMIAAATSMVQKGLSAKTFLLNDRNTEARIAVTLFRADTGVTARDWVVDRDKTSFDLYLVMADRIPNDEITLGAIGQARLVLLGLMFPDHRLDLPSGVVAVDGHDTTGFGDAAMRLLGIRTCPSSR